MMTSSTSKPSKPPSSSPPPPPAFCLHPELLSLISPWLVEAANNPSSLNSTATSLAQATANWALSHLSSQSTPTSLSILVNTQLQEQGLWDALGFAAALLSSPNPPQLTFWAALHAKAVSSFSVFFRAFSTAPAFPSLLPLYSSQLAQAALDNHPWASELLLLSKDACSSLYIATTTPDESKSSAHLAALLDKVPPSDGKSILLRALTAPPSPPSLSTVISATAPDRDPYADIHTTHFVQMALARMEGSDSVSVLHTLAGPEPGLSPTAIPALNWPLFATWLHAFHSKHRAPMNVHLDALISAVSAPNATILAVVLARAVYPSGLWETWMVKTLLPKLSSRDSQQALNAFFHALIEAEPLAPHAPVIRFAALLRKVDPTDKPKPRPSCPLSDPPSHLPDLLNAVINIIPRLDISPWLSSLPSSYTQALAAVAPPAGFPHPETLGRLHALISYPPPLPSASYLAEEVLHQWASVLFGYLKSSPNPADAPLAPGSSDALRVILSALSSSPPPSSPWAAWMEAWTSSGFDSHSLTKLEPHAAPFWMTWEASRHWSFPWAQLELRLSLQRHGLPSTLTSLLKATIDVHHSDHVIISLTSEFVALLSPPQQSSAASIMNSLIPSLQASPPRSWRTLGWIWWTDPVWSTLLSPSLSYDLFAWLWFARRPSNSPIPQEYAEPLQALCATHQLPFNDNNSLFFG